MNDRKREPWRAPYVTGEYAISGMWYLPVCRGRICRNPDCDNGVRKSPEKKIPKPLA